MDKNICTYSVINSEDNNIYALSIGDAMAGMMLILLMAFLAIFLQMNSIPNQSKEIVDLQEKLKDLQEKLKIVEERNRNEAEKYFSMKKQIYNSLVNEFSDDLERWNARIDANTLAFILENSDNGFKSGSDEIPREFIVMLNQFIPRYLNVIRQYDQYIDEIRIEGNTSSEWGDNITECTDSNESCKQLAYIKNMELSQARAMSVLNHILLMDNIANNRDWIRAKLTANGLSSSHLLCGAEKKLCTGNPSDKENREASRRVEFSIRTNAESKIQEFLKADAHAGRNLPSHP